MMINYILCKYKVRYWKKMGKMNSCCCLGPGRVQQETKILLILMHTLFFFYSIYLMLFIVFNSIFACFLRNI